MSDGYYKLNMLEVIKYSSTSGMPKTEATNSSCFLSVLHIAGQEKQCLYYKNGSLKFTATLYEYTRDDKAKC